MFTVVVADPPLKSLMFLPVNDVRDEGVAGSNPATPTNKINYLAKSNFEAPGVRDRNGDRNGLSRSGRRSGFAAM
jgi:hypothetical protein